MQSAGALNTGGTLATLAISYGVPIVMIVADRGHLGDVTVAHFEKGRAFRPFLNALGIPHYDLAPAHIENVLRPEVLGGVEEGACLEPGHGVKSFPAKGDGLTSAGQP